MVSTCCAAGYVMLSRVAYDADYLIVGRVCPASFTPARRVVAGILATYDSCASARGGNKNPLNEEYFGQVHQGRHDGHGAEAYTIEAGALTDVVSFAPTNALSSLTLLSASF